MLAVLRHDQRLADTAGGNAVSASTVRRWLLEVIRLLATRAERLERALKKAIRKGGHLGRPPPRASCHHTAPRRLSLV